MVRLRRILSIFFSLILAFTIGVAQAQYDPALYDQDGYNMLDRCRNEGSVALVDELLKNEQKEWREVMQKIATGNTQWINASACLSHGVYYGLNLLSDYAYATLMDAWAQALLKNPKDVLRRSGEISLTVLCSLPLDFREFSVEFADDFLENALAALEITEEDNDYYRRNKTACAFYLKLDHERFIAQLKEYENGH